MARSTLVLSGVVVLLVLATSYVAWRIITNERTQVAAPEGLHLGIGLPEAVADVSPESGAGSVVWWDSEAGVIRSERNGFMVRPLASLTKLMTAMVAIDHGLVWDRPTEILPEEYVIGGRLLLQPGELVTVRDLFHASLVGSANNATLAYVRTLGLAEKEFVREMNRKAIALGLEQTRFVDVTGLDPDNVSTAYEVARLAEVAFRDYPAIAGATSMREYSFTVGGSGRAHVISNTNKLISEQGLSFSGSKTGYLNEAGFCLVVRGMGKAARYIVAVLGAPSEQDAMAEIQQAITDF